MFRANIIRILVLVAIIVGFRTQASDTSADWRLLNDRIGSQNLSSCVCSVPSL